MELCSDTRPPCRPTGDVGHQQYKAIPPLVPVMWKCSTKGGESDHECGARKPQLAPNELKARPGQKKKPPGTKLQG